MTVRPVRLWLVRHGSTQWNDELRYQGTTDVALSDAGRIQAEALSRRFADVHLDAIMSSTLSRAVETASVIARRTAQSVATDPRLNELHLGVAEGLTWDEVRERFPSDAAAWNTGDPHLSFTQGESPCDAQRRVVDAMTDLQCRWSGCTLLLVTHGGPLRLFLCHMLGMDVASSWKLQISPASVSQLDVYPEGGILSLLNDTGHLHGSRPSGAAVNGPG